MVFFQIGSFHRVVGPMSFWKSYFCTPIDILMSKKVCKFQLIKVVVNPISAFHRLFYTLSYHLLHSIRFRTMVIVHSSYIRLWFACYVSNILNHFYCAHCRPGSNKCWQGCLFTRSSSSSVKHATVYRVPYTHSETARWVACAQPFHDFANFLSPLSSLRLLLLQSFRFPDAW